MKRCIMCLKYIKRNESWTETTTEMGSNYLCGGLPGLPDYTCENNYDKWLKLSFNDKTKITRKLIKLEKQPMEPK